MAVYFIQVGEDGPVKIGLSKNPWRRLSKIRTDHDRPARLIRLFEGGREEERSLHRQFVGHRIKGEWFTPVDAILSGPIDLAPLNISQARAAPRPGWTEDSYRRFSESQAKRRLDPASQAKRKASSALCGARIGAAGRLTRALSAVADLNSKDAPFQKRLRAKREMRSALSRLTAYHARFPSLIADARAAAAGQYEYTSRRLVAAFDAFAAAHVCAPARASFT